MPTTRFYGWKLVAACWLILFINLAFPAYGSSVINAYMVTDLHLDRKTLGLMVSVFLIMGGLPGPLVASCVNRIGARMTLIIGSLVLLAGALLMAIFVNVAWQAVLVFGLLIGIGVLTGGALAAQTSVAFWFLKRRALALALILSAAGIGGFIAAPLLDRIITAADGNWRMGWWLIAGLAFISTLVAMLFVINKPEDIGQAPDGVEVGEHNSATSPAAQSRVFMTTDAWTLGAVMRSPTLWLLMLGAVGLSAGYALFIAHGVVHLKDLGHTPAMAALSVSFMVFANLVGKLLLGALGDRIEPRLLWAAASAIFSVGMYLLVNATTIYAFAICLGLGFGAFVVCMMTVLSNYYGTQVYASVVGIAMAVQTTAGAIAPLVAGHLYDTTGSYSTSFYTVAALCFAGAVILALVKPPLMLKAKKDGIGETVG
jgi:MFS family permease